MHEPTPTLDPSHPRRYADFSTLPEALDYAAGGKRGVNFYSPRGELESSITYAQIRDRAHEIGRRLVHFGIKRYSRVALIAETNEDFVCYFLGCQYAGLLPVPLPLPTSFGGRDGYTEQLHQQMKSCEASVALSAAYMLPLLDEATNGLGMEFIGSPDTFEAQASLAEIKNVKLPEVHPEDLAYLQYSSGSTRFPHGVAVTHSSLVSNCHGIGVEAMDVNDDDRVVSWLPFYHDMGLVGMLLSPITCQVSIDYIATEAFARRPIQWLKLISRNKGTICSSPTFGYEICARRANSTDLEGLDLSSWRVAGIGADMIRPDVLEMFAEKFKDCGYNKKAFMPSYGLAECTLAVSFAPTFSGYTVDLVSEDVLNGDVKSVKEYKKNGNGANYREVVNCGKPLSSYNLEIRDEKDVV
ncbi:MAG: AMP-binding protein, partial [Kordiimonadaceae bacterium]|nr:AMP-binding protein [Kordiimonadaceae bacterium]